jgi:23S rRNA pseudouridine1911/1915/1917 synthase
MAVRETGKPAITHYRVMKKFRSHTHLRLKLESGRTHQIRVHMAHIKHPIVGDQAYGGRPRIPKNMSQECLQQLRSFKRQALHAAQLSLYHPVSEEWLSWQAPLPVDMKGLLADLGQDTLDHGLDD